MTTEFQNNSFEQKQARLADEPAGPEQKQNESRPEMSHGGDDIADTPSLVSPEPRVETGLEAGQNDNGAAESESAGGGEAEAWQEELGEAEVVSDDEEGAGTSAEAVESGASESVAEKLKNKLRRKAPAPEIKKMKADLEKAVSDNEALRDKYLRLAAEFDNYRKRIDRDFNNRVQSAFAELVGELLPVLDDLERSLNTKAESQNHESLLEGVRLIQQKFAKVLADRGLAPIQAVGAEFDPNLHDALTEMAVEGKPAGIVLEEQTRGYTYRDRVLRPARVIVSK